MSTPAGWYADPSGRFPHRYWDGTAWTEHVGGPQGAATDPLPSARPQQQDRPAATSTEVDTTAVFQAPTLALLRYDHGDITQTQYVTSEHTLVLDAVEEPKEPEMDNDSVDELTRKSRTTTMRVVDAAGTVIARVAHVKPWKSDFTITDAAGIPLLTGEQENVLGAPRFSFVDAGSGQPVAMIRADSAKARAFTIEAPDGSVVATLDKLGSYDIDMMMREIREDMPFKTAGNMLYDETLGKLLHRERDKLRFVLTRPQPIAWEPLALVALLSPMVIELSLSVL